MGRYKEFHNGIIKMPQDSVIYKGFQRHAPYIALS